MPASNPRFAPSFCAFAFLAMGCFSGGWAQTLDIYGGYTGLSGHNTSGFFRTEKIGDRWYLVTPDNHAMISIAMTGILYYDSWGTYCPAIDSRPNAYTIRAMYNNDRTAWEADMKATLRGWGFNGIGSWSEQGIANFTENAPVIGVVSTCIGAGMARLGRNFVDVWDPRFTQTATQCVQQLGTYATSPYRIGAFPDNELGWVGWDAWNTGGDKLPDLFIKLPATSPGKQYWAGALLAGKYATIEDLNAAYGTAFTSFTGSESTSLVNTTALPNDPAHPAIFADKQDFMEAIAERYYSTVSAAMRTKDPNHLVFSSRWAFFTTAYDVGCAEQQAYNERVWRAEGRHCDIIAVNGYPHTFWLETNHQFYTRMCQAAAGKPFMITEYSASGNDTRYIFHDPTYTSWQIWGYYPFQRYRGEDYVVQMDESLNLAVQYPQGGEAVHPFVGLQWFYYVDEPSLGRPDGEANNCGLLNVPNEAYTTAVDVIASYNARLYAHLVDGAGLQLLDAPQPVRPAPPPAWTTASASSTEPGWIPSSVLDRNPYSDWSTTPQQQTGSQWLTVNLAAPTPVHAVLIRPRPKTSPPSNTFPIDFRLQYNNAGNWTDLPGHVYQNYPDPLNTVQYFACTPPVTTGGLRLLATKFGLDETGAYRMQIADVWVITGSSQSDRPTFEWTAPPGAASYTLLYSPEMSFPNAQTVRVENLGTTSYTPTEPLAPGLWYWCVRAADSAGFGGRYGDPVPFVVTASPSGVSTASSLGMETLAAWPNTNQESGGWNSAAWAFLDSTRKTAGNTSARVVFTMNSMNKLTGAKNARTTNIVWAYAGPALWLPTANQISFDIRPARAADAAGAVTVASKFISLRVRDGAGQVILDQRIDPNGTLPPLTWQTRSFALSTPHNRNISSFEWYVDTSVASPTVPWDQRLTVWLDNIAITPINSRADFDLDYDVDQEDFGLLQACLRGPGVPQNDPSCLDARLDGDDDVDADDVALFLRCMRGSNVIADPSCPN